MMRYLLLATCLLAVAWAVPTAAAGVDDCSIVTAVGDGSDVRVVDGYNIVEFLVDRSSCADQETLSITASKILKVTVYDDYTVDSIFGFTVFDGCAGDALVNKLVHLPELIDTTAWPHPVCVHVYNEGSSSAALTTVWLD